MFRRDRELQDKLELFLLQYATEDACAEALFFAKWPNGFSCPRCGGKQAYKLTTRKIYECAACKYQASLIAGTVFENSRTDLTKWFTALFLVSQPSGISAVKLQGLIQTTYKTAWLILSKLRYAMSQECEGSLLNGIVRVNTAIYGTRYMKSIGDWRGEHSVVIGASVDQEGEPNQVKIRLIPGQHPDEFKGRREAAEAFKTQHVDPEAVDVRSVYKRCSNERFMPLLSLVNKATRWIHKTFGGIRAKHLQAYLDEFSYRNNAANLLRLEEKEASNQNSAVFDSVLQLCSSRLAPTYFRIVHLR
jgi:predicted RNA-binding Zn-ribbon protein involved in translation (DUF1610 family)